MQCGLLCALVALASHAPFFFSIPFVSSFFASILTVTVVVFLFYSQPEIQSHV